MHRGLKTVVSVAVSLLLLGGLASAQEWGGVMRVVPSSTITGLDPFQTGGWAPRMAKENIFEPLVTVGYDGALEGRVASSWEFSEDGLEMIFHLRHGLTFHNGAPVTANDVKYSLDRARNPETGRTSWALLVNIDHIDVIDGYTVKVVFSQPDRLFITQIYNYSFVIPADDSIDQLLAPVGSGPFKFVELTEEHLVLERFDGYYLEGLPYLDGLEFVFVAEASTKVFMLETEAVDFLKAAPLANAADLAPNPDVFLDFGENIEGPVVFFLPGLTTDTPIADPLVRQAISYALDREQIINVAFGGSSTGSTVRSTLVPADDPLYNPNQTVYTRDIAKAKQLLTDAGYPNGLTMDFHPLLRTPEDEVMAAIVQQNCADAGITLNIVRMDVPAWVADLRAIANPLPLSTTYSMPGALEQMWMIQGRMHAGYTGLPDYDPVFWERQVAAGAIADKDEFEAEVFELQRISSEQQYVIVIGDIPTLYAMRTYVKHFRSHPIGNMYFRQVWMEQ